MNPSCKDAKYKMREELEKFARHRTVQLLPIDQTPTEFAKMSHQQLLTSNSIQQKKRGKSKPNNSLRTERNDELCEVVPSIVASRVQQNLVLSKRFLAMQFTMKKFALRWRMMQLHNKFLRWKQEMPALIRLWQCKLEKNKNAAIIRRCYRGYLTRQLAWKVRQHREVQEVLENVVVQASLIYHQVSIRCATIIQRQYRGFIERCRIFYNLQTTLRRLLGSISASKLYSNTIEVQNSSIIFKPYSPKNLEKIWQTTRSLVIQKPAALSFLKIIISRIYLVQSSLVQSKCVDTKARSKLRQRHWQLDGVRKQKKVKNMQRSASLILRNIARNAIANIIQLRAAQTQNEMKIGIQRYLDQKAEVQLILERENREMYREECRQRKKLIMQDANFIENQKLEKLHKDISSAMDATYRLERELSQQKLNRLSMTRAFHEQKLETLIAEYKLQHPENVFSIRGKNWTNTRIQMFSRCLPHIVCPSTKICALEVFASVTVDNIGYCFHHTNTQSIRHGLVPPKVFDRIPYKSLCHHEVRELSDHHVYIVFATRSKQSIDMLITGITIKQRIHMSIPISHLCLLLTVATSKLLLVQHTKSLLQYCIQRIDLCRNKKSLILLSETIIHDYGGNNALIEPCVGKAFQSISKYVPT